MILVGPRSGFRTGKAMKQFSLDLLILLCMITVPITLFKIGKPTNRGFFCDDQTLDYPYQESTISTAVMVIYTLLIPIISIPLYEALGYHRNIVTHTKTLENKHKYKMNFLFNVYHNIWLFIFGYALTQTTIDIAKYSIGRLRPHFFDLCKPNFYQKCNPHIFIRNYTCTSGTSFRIREVKLSFVSGHAALACYSFVFLAYFLQVHEATRRYTITKAILQAVYFWIALYTSYTRVSDFKHHWSDVFAGALFGSLTAILIMRYIYTDKYNTRCRRLSDACQRDMDNREFTKMDTV
ncbi:unnamed protein product [Gordionus sp. m RMFG-2023]